MPQQLSAQNDRVRELNRHAVYRVLLGHRPLSRNAVAREADLSVPTVATILQEFVELGLVEEVGRAQSGGRPAQLVRLRPDARLALGIDLSGPRLRAGFVDLLGRVQLPLEGPRLGPGCETDLFDWLAETVDAAAARGRPAHALALAVPGVIEPGSGHVRLAPALGWDDYPLAENLHEHTGLEVVLENDVNALALAELHYGAGARHQHVLYVTIGSGIGAGLVIGGKLYRGAHSAAGEIGYSLLPGLPEAGMNLGEAGPLERHLLQASQAFLREGCVQLDTPAARHAFDAFAGTLRTVLHNLACALNPELLVIAWPADTGGQLAAALRERWNAPLPLAIQNSELSSDAALQGAAQLALIRLAETMCQTRTGEEHGR